MKDFASSERQQLFFCKSAILKQEGKVETTVLASLYLSITILSGLYSSIPIHFIPCFKLCPRLGGASFVSQTFAVYHDQDLILLMHYKLRLHLKLISIISRWLSKDNLSSLLFALVTYRHVKTD